MWTRSGILSSIAAILVAAGLTACGGGNSPPAAASTFVPRTVDYELARLGDLGLREAFVTLNGRTDGKTTAVVDFYVPRVDGANDDVYPTAIRGGGCPDAGAVQHDLGPLSAGTSVLVVDAGIDDLAGALDDGDAAVVIMSPDGKKVAWCGP
jgi:hypothetical protein